MTQVLHDPVPVGDIEQGDDSPAIVSATTHVRDGIVETAAKLALREGRHDKARDNEILAWCREAAMQFVDAPIQAFVPLLVERIVRDRIRRERHRDHAAADATDRSARLWPCQPASS